MQLNIEWMQHYLTRDDPVKCLGTYVAMLVLRFERKSNYERVLDFEDILSSTKFTLRELLGPSAAARAYLTGLEFVNELFKRHPEALQAKYRIHLLELAESTFYNAILKSFNSVIMYEVQKVPEDVRVRVGRFLQEVKYGKVPIIDKTCSGSVYISKVDVASSIIGKNIVSQNVQTISQYLAKVGILKPEYMRIIVPAPALEDSHIRRLTKILDRCSEDIVEELSHLLMIMGYVLVDDSVHIIEGTALRLLIFEKQTSRTRFRICVAVNLEAHITKKHVDVLASICTSSRCCLTFLIVKTVSPDVRSSSSVGVSIIEVSDADRKSATSYVKNEVLREILDISSLSKLQDVYKLLDNIIQIV